MDKLRTTNFLLLIIALPVGFIVLQKLGFIVIPLLFAMFIALLFLPLMRWLKKKKVNQFFSLFLVGILISLFFFLGIELAKLASAEILATKNEVLSNIDSKLKQLLLPLENRIGSSRTENQDISKYYFDKLELQQHLFALGMSFKSLITNLLIILFFVILLLAESLNFQKIINSTLVKQKSKSIIMFNRIEKDMQTFVKVKFFVSFLTGLGFTIFCYLFDVSFPIFWGLLAFALNFIQMIGSIVSVLLLSIFAFVEIQTMGTLLFFIALITLVQVLFGAILEPIFMGKSFSINVIIIVMMIMFWGFIWGIPGMILSIPITVFIKIVLEQYPKTKKISQLILGSD
jgi:predicted PurR-regulated permease PerM